MLCSYDFEAKQKYRERRELAVSRIIGKPIPLRRVAYLDTGEALDTLFYLNRGYRAENLWPINKSPAEVAHITMKVRRAGFSDVNTVGLDFEHALERRVPNSIDIIDFDGTSTMHSDLARMIGRVGSKRPKCVYGLTVLAGRENRTGSTGRSNYRLASSFESSHCRTSTGRVVRASHFQRLRTLVASLQGQELLLDHVRQLFDEAISAGSHPHLAAENAALHASVPCSLHIDEIFWDVYDSTSGQPMLHAVIRTQTHSYPLPQKKVRSINKRTYGIGRPRCYGGFSWYLGGGPEALENFLKTTDDVNKIIAYDALLRLMEREILPSQVNHNGTETTPTV